MHQTSFSLSVIAAIAGGRFDDLISFLVVLVIVGMYLLITFSVSKSGWSGLARVLRREQRPKGRQFTSVHASFGDASYKGVVKAVACEEGLWFSCMFLCRVFHPPFMLPWKSVAGARLQDGWLSRGYVLQIKDPAGSFTIRFKPAFRSALEQFRPDLVAGKA